MTYYDATHSKPDLIPARSWPGGTPINNKDLMLIQQTSPIFRNKLKLKTTILACIVFFIGATVTLDFRDTLFRKSAFYLSESLLFSSYWVLFLPLLALVVKITRQTNRFEVKLLVPSLAIALHLFLYPALVWVLSKAFYYHTFDYWQTFNFGLSAYFIKTIIVYAFAFAAFTLVRERNGPSRAEMENKVEEEKITRSLLVTDPNNKKILLQIDDILYFSANSPYINIHHSDKKYVHTETLKALEAQLDKNQFVRIHKSHIVNVRKISSVQSRQNGDYDATLSDGTILRVSRNYTKDFKSLFSKQHQVSLK